jgi:cytoskeletal protein CcmA (bactofilin family)
MARRLSAICALVLLTIAISAAPAVARDGGVQGDRRISVTGDIVVAKGDVVRGPVITVDGNVTIAGTVRAYVGVGDGDLVVSGHVTRGVVVVHGDARISGHVEGDVVALTGRVIVTAAGQVDGDVVSRLEPRVARGTVHGDVKRVDLAGIFTGLIIGFLALLWLAVTISIAVIGLAFVGLFPRAADTATAAGRRVGASIGWGALVGIVGPFVAVLVLVTIVGLPLGIGMLALLNVLAPLGYVTSALMIGRIWVKSQTNRGRLGAFFAGFGILRLVALIPGIGLLVWFLACVYGIGALSMAAWYGGRPRPTGAPDAIAPEDTAPAPDAPSGPDAAPVPAPAPAPAAAGPAPDESTPEPAALAWSPSTAPTAEGNEPAKPD